MVHWIDVSAADALDETEATRSSKAEDLSST